MNTLGFSGQRLRSLVAATILATAIIKEVLLKEALSFLWRQLRFLLRAVMWSAMLVAMCLAIGLWLSWLAQQHGQDPVIGRHAAVILMLVGYAVIVVNMSVRRFADKNTMGWELLFLTPIIAVLVMVSREWRIPSFVLWWWGVTAMAIWTLLNVPKTPRSKWFLSNTEEFAGEE